MNELLYLLKRLNDDIEVCHAMLKLLGHKNLFESKIDNEYYHTYSGRLQQAENTKAIVERMLKEGNPHYTGERTLGIY